MKPEEAISMICGQQRDLFNTILDALEKEKEKSVFRLGELCECPKCKAYVDDKYCPKCGQHLKWSEENDT